MTAQKGTRAQVEAAILWLSEQEALWRRRIKGRGNRRTLVRQIRGLIEEPLRWRDHQEQQTTIPAFRVDTTAEVSIPSDVSLERTPPIAVRRAHSGRFSRFDYKGLFYDVFFDRSEIRLAGPPAANLEGYLRSASMKVDGFPVGPWTELRSLRRRQDSYIVWRGQASEVTMTFKDFVAQVRPAPIDRGTFAGRHVLLTINKDNRLEWVYDWARFYVNTHGIDSVLLYDNGSTTYSSDELLNTIRSVPGIRAVVVVEWPFKYGPGREFPNVPADANYCQVVMLDHAKRRYLRRAKTVVNCDVDELIYSYSGQTVVEAIEKARMGLVRFRGTWIEPATERTEGIPRHKDFHFIDPERRPPFLKWAVCPERLPAEADWQVHNVRGVTEPEPEPDFHFGHFRGISLRHNRVQLAPIVPGKHVPFPEIEVAMRRAFGAT